MMNDFIYKFLPMVLSLTLGRIIYLKIDQKYQITNIINSKLRLKQEWKALFCLCCIFISGLIFGILGIYVINVPPAVYFILCGLLAGAGIGIVNKLSSKKNL
ncbi:MAG TPA: hypothetical protein VF941_04455 [Clostridia bacterium]